VQGWIDGAAAVAGTMVFAAGVAAAAGVSVASASVIASVAGSAAIVLTIASGAVTAVRYARGEITGNECLGAMTMTALGLAAVPFGVKAWVGDAALAGKALGAGRAIASWLMDLGTAK
jgi:hypothetical protein